MHIAYYKKLRAQNEKLKAKACDPKFKADSKLNLQILYYGFKFLPSVFDTFLYSICNAAY